MPRLCDTAEIVAHASQQHQTLDCAASGHAQTRTSAEIRRSRCGYWGRGALALSRSLRVALLVLATTGCTGYVHSDQDPGSENCESGSCSEGVTPPDSGEVTPGFVVARRLNRLEYDNTVRDLFGFESGYRASREFGFTADEFRLGFNNNALGLTVAPLDAENYLRAAKAIAEKAVAGIATDGSKLQTCDPIEQGDEECVKRIIEALAHRAFRRPLEVGELEPVFGVAALARSEGEPFDTQLELALSAVLLAPDFLFRIEPPPSSDKARKLTSYEIASRLSYFLWASMPDDELFRAASEDELQSPEQITAQVERMLQDPKADALASDLAGQWFQTLGLADVVRDPERFPQFTEDLREAMAAEVELLLRDAIRGQLSAKELLTTDVSYINHDLAELYGLDATSLGQELERTPLGDPKRGGLLRTAAFLTVNAEAGHNSPVRRGKWVLERLLCDPPPPPPANVPGFEPKTGVEEGSLRDQLEAFFEGREVCAGCHDAMNPIGFAFEHYDSLGRFRETDNGFEIDTSGTLYGSGASFDGVDELISAVIEDDRFASCMVEKVFAYALGRDLRREDESVIAQTAEKFKATDYRFPDLFELVATSRLMTERSPESP